MIQSSLSFGETVSTPSKTGYHYKVFDELACGKTVRTLTFSTDEKCLAAVSDDGILKIWDVPSIKLIRKDSFRAKEISDAMITSLMFTSDASRFACASLDGLRVWNSDDMKLVFKHDFYQAWYADLRFNKINGRITFASIGGDVYQYDKTGKEMSHFKIATTGGKDRLISGVGSFALNEKGDKVAGFLKTTASIHVREADTGKQIFTLLSPNTEKVFFIPGRKVLSAIQKNKIAFYNLKTGNHISEHFLGKTWPVAGNRLAFSPETKFWPSLAMHINLFICLIARMTE